MTSQKVSFASENVRGVCPGVISGEYSTTEKGLIVIQEWWGMNDDVISIGRELAQKGDFITLVPDLYRGTLTTDYEEAGHLMETLDWPGAVKDVQGAARYLRSNGCKKVGVTGFCMGGALSLAAAVLVPEVDASAPFYGIPKPELCDLTKAKIPLQCHFGNKDAIEGFSAPKDQETLCAKLDFGNVKYEFFSYNGAAHAFANVTSPNFNREYYDLAMTRVYDFMLKHLSN